MIQKIKAIMTKMAVLSLLVAPLAVPAVVYGQAVDEDNPITRGLNRGTCLETTEGGSGTDCPEADEADEKVNGIITLVINIFSLVVGVISVIMIIIGGLKYITSGGDSGNVTGAKNTILYAIIGLVIVALAQLIVRFVLGRVTTAGE